MSTEDGTVPLASAVVFGGTGLVGRAVVERLAAEPWVDSVRVPVRRPVDAWEAMDGVETVRVDYERLAEHGASLAATHVFLCLGTTMKKAGSKEAFRAVDLELTVEVARMARSHGARHAYLVSSVGADPDSRVFYLRTKGEAEGAVAALGFESLHVARPAILTGPREESRPGERLGILVGRLLAPLMVGPLRRQRPIAADTVAAALVAAARDPGSGRVVHESEELQRHADG